MQLKFLILTGLVLGLTGAATAGPFEPEGEESLKLDLSAVGGPTYFLKCSRSQSPTDCGFVTVWVQTNQLAGLQTGIFNTGGRGLDPDSRLLA